MHVVSYPLRRIRLGFLELNWVAVASSSTRVPLLGF